jgi:hypothetical protein
VLRRVFFLAGSLLVAACGTLLSGDEDGFGNPPSEAGTVEAAPTIDDGGADADAAILCDPGDADLTTDPSHCGFCGRQCEDGVCTAGRCNALRFADNPSGYRGALDMAGSGASVFIADDHAGGAGGGILRCSPVPSAGQKCTLERIFSRPFMAGISVDPAFVYYGSKDDTQLNTDIEGGVGRVAFDAAAVSAVSSVDRAFDAYDVAFDGTQLYVASDTGLFTCPMPGCAPLSPVNGTAPSLGVVADASGYCAVAMDASSVRCAASASAPPVTIHAELNEKITAIAVSGDYLFWTSSGPGPEAKWSRRDGAANGALPGLGGGSRVVAAVGEDVYAAIEDPEDPTRGAILRCTRTSCTSAKKIASSPLPTITALTVLGPYVYFGAEDATINRGLFRVAR